MMRFEQHSGALAISSARRASSGARVERAPDDEPRDAALGAGARRRTSLLGADAARGDHGDRDRRRERGGRVEVRAPCPCRRARCRCRRAPRRRRPRSGARRRARRRRCVSSQPSTATRPSRASMPTAMRPGWRRAASRTSAGSRSAAVPRIARSTPSASASSIASSDAHPAAELRPGTSFAAVTIARTASRLRGRPARAPSRSTTCTRGAPAATKRAATAPGSSP